MEGRVPRLTVDLELSDEEEISCELELFSKEDDNVGSEDKRGQSDGDNGTVLDWSISAISASGGYAPDRFHTDFEPSSTSASASAWSSPEKVDRLKPHETSAADEQESSRKTPDTILKGNHKDREIAQTETDIKQLVGNIQNLRSNIESIYQKTLTPVSSPRHTKNVRRQNYARSSTSDEDEAQSANDPSVTPKAKVSHSHYGVAFNTTPPVKDPGMKKSEYPHPNIESLKEQIINRASASTTTSMAQTGGGNNAAKTSLVVEPSKSTSSTVRLDQMRTVLKDLENARKKYSASKIPRRNLNFDSMLKKAESEKEKEIIDSTKHFSTSSNNAEKSTASTSNRLIAREMAPSRKTANDESGTTVQERDDSEQSTHKPFPDESKSLFEREFEEMDTYLNQVKNTPTPIASTLLLLESGRLSSEQSTSQLPIGSNVLGIEKPLQDATESIKMALEKEMKLRQELEAVVASLKKQVMGQTEQIGLLEKANNDKLQLLFEIKTRWSEVAQQWMQDQQELAQKLKDSHEEVAKLKSENMGAKEQFSVCQEELQKALQIATDFKLKLEEEEQMKNDVLNELLAQKSSMLKQLQVEQVKCNEMADENEALKLEMERLKNEHLHLVATQNDVNKQTSDDLVKAKEEGEKLRQENKELIQNINDMTNEKDAIERSLHTFYASQMESILTDKIATLQSNVKIWETNMAREKQEAMEILQNQHVIQMESLAKRYTKDMDTSKNDIKVLKASLSASRKEADALREQLGLERTRFVSNRTKTSSALARPSSSSSSVTPTSAQNAVLPLDERNYSSQQQFQSFSLLYNNHELASGEESKRAKDRQQKLWSEILNSSAFRNHPFSMVQNNLFGIPNSEQRSTIQLMNGNRAADDPTSSSSSNVENLSEQQEDASRRSLPGELVPRRDKHGVNSRSLRHDRRTTATTAELHPPSNNVVSNGMFNALSSLTTSVNYSSTDDRQSENMQLQRSKTSAASNNQTLDSIPSGILQTLLEKHSIYNQMTSADRTDDVLMTTEEKKEVVKGFVKGLFEDYPEAALDPQLLFDLNKMAVRLVDQSTHGNEGNASVSSPSLGISSINKASNFELKKMLAEQMSNNPSLAGQAGLGASNNPKAQKSIQKAHVTLNNKLPKKGSSTKNNDNISKERTHTTNNDEQERGRYSSDS